jgi:hypothetical protein
MPVAALVAFVLLIAVLSALLERALIARRWWPLRSP